MSNSRGRTERAERDDSIHNVDTAERNCPLQLPDHLPTLALVLFIAQRGVVELWMAGPIERRTDSALLGVLTKHTTVTLHETINVATGAPGANSALGLILVGASKVAAEEEIRFIASFQLEAKGLELVKESLAVLLPA